jgi:hypothetical protein
MRFFDILQWTIIAAIVVVVVMNASKDVGFLATFGNFWIQETNVLTGSNYNGPAPAMLTTPKAA